MAFRSEAEALRDEQERVASKKPWLAFSRHEPVTPKPPERDVYAWVILDEVFEERS